MINGIRVADMDTHVDPNLAVLEKYVDPAFRPRLPELEPYKLVRQNIRRGPDEDTVGAVGLSMGALPFNRWPGTKLEPGHQTAGGPGQAGARAGTVSFHRGPVTPGVEDENSEGRLIDMDLEGRDLDFVFPGLWASTLTGIYHKDVTLAEGMYRAYHNYMDIYTSVAPDRIKSSLQVPGSDPEWAISEIRKWANSKWVAAVWIHLPPDLPVDDPDLDPVFATMNDLDLPLVHHGFFMEPPYFPGHQDIWGNSVVARTAAHPWGAARLCAYLIVSGLFDKYPNLRASVSEVGHGWLPNWVIRLDFNKSYAQGLTPNLKYTPMEYVRMGRFRCAAEPFEGPLMTEACVKILGEDCLMHQSDYPHGQAWFPETAKEVMEWDFWGKFSREALRKHMYGNAAGFLRMA